MTDVSHHIYYLSVTKVLKGREKQINFKRMKTSTIDTIETAEMQGHRADREIERASRQPEREIVQQPIAEALMHNPELEGLNEPEPPVGGRWQRQGNVGP